MYVRFLRPVALVCTVFVMATAGESLMAQQGRPIPAPAPIGNQPRLGITASPYRQNTPNGQIVGVRVNSDSARRVLHYTDSNGNRRTARFRTGYDIILTVNGSSVTDSQDVLNSLQFGWNTLRIWDRHTGITDDYEVEIR